MIIIGNSSNCANGLSSSAGVIFLQRVEILTTVDIVSVEGWLSAGDADWAERIMCIYADGSGPHPTTLIARSAKFFGPPDFTVAQFSAPVSATLTPGFYWFGAQLEHDSSNGRYEESAGYFSYRMDGGSFDTLPDLTGIGIVYTDNRLAFSATANDIVVVNTTPRALTPKNAISIQSTVKTIKARRI